MSKPVNLLTLDDFSAYPIWKYATDEEGTDGRDETWVRPVSGRVVPARAYTVVAADFEARCGRHFEGYVFVSTLDDVADCCQGVILVGHERFFIANPEVAFYVRLRAELLAGVALNEHELFPIAFRLRVPIEGERSPWAGILP